MKTRSVQNKSKHLLRRYAIPTELLLLISLVGSAYAETYYKWQDDNGNWIYGANAPKGVDAIEVKTHVGNNKKTPDTNAEPSTDDTSDTLADGSTINREMCERARGNLDALNSGAIIQRLNQDGESVTLGAEEMAAEKEKAQAAINHFCLGFKQ